jgi:diacylglycerol kinase
VSARSCYNSFMPNVYSPDAALYILQILVSAFLAVLFLQSGIDKVVDRNGNRAYLDQHFARSPLAGTVGPMFLLITILEVSAGALSGVGCILLFLTHDSMVAFLGAVVAGINIIALFLGQRVAKDYAGAAALVPYFLVALAGIYILAEH